VARNAIIFGILLTVLGVVLYASSDLEAMRRLTALIPSAFGLALVLLGQIARGGSDKARMHTMHAAAVIGLVGLVGGVVMTILDVRKLGSEPPPSNLAMGGKAAMAILSGIFLGLCIKSFIDGRKARKQRETSPTEAK
jgi:hypothetical protein